MTWGQVFILDIPEWFLTRYHSKGWEDFREVLERGSHVRIGYEKARKITVIIS